MRPKPRAIMPSTVSRIISMWHSIMLSIAEIQSARVQLRKIAGQAAVGIVHQDVGLRTGSSAALRPSGVGDIGGDRRGPSRRAHGSPPRCARARRASAPRS
jgi:hypothetical protein